MPSFPVNVTYNNAFAFAPPTVQAPKGLDSIVFNRIPAQASWAFVGISIWLNGSTKPNTMGSMCSPFSTSGPSSDGSSLTVSDDNTATADTTYQYQVWIQLADGSQVSSDPQIINKGG